MSNQVTLKNIDNSISIKVIDTDNNGDADTVEATITKDGKTETFTDHLDVTGNLSNISEFVQEGKVKDALRSIGITKLKSSSQISGLEKYKNDLASLHEKWDTTSKSKDHIKSFSGNIAVNTALADITIDVQAIKEDLWNRVIGEHLEKSLKHVQSGGTESFQGLGALQRLAQRDSVVVTVDPKAQNEIAQISEKNEALTRYREKIDFSKNETSDPSKVVDAIIGANEIAAKWGFSQQEVLPIIETQLKSAETGLDQAVNDGADRSIQESYAERVNKFRTQRDEFIKKAKAGKENPIATAEKKLWQGISTFFQIVEKRVDEETTRLREPNFSDGIDNLGKAWTEDRFASEVGDQAENMAKEVEKWWDSF